MKLNEAVVVSRGSVTVPASRVGDVDPENDAIRIARRELDTLKSPDADRYSYSAHREGDVYRVVVEGHSRASAFEDLAGYGGAAGEVQLGGFEETEVADWRSVDVADLLYEKLTVADLRELGREHDVSNPRGANKRELVERFVERAPDAAKSVVRGLPRKGRTF